MTRGRPPREDGRRTIAIRIAATPTEEKLINSSYTTDGKREILMSWGDVRRLVREARTIADHINPIDHVYLIGTSELCESFREAIQRFDGTIPVHETV